MRIAALLLAVVLLGTFHIAMLLDGRGRIGQTFEVRQVESRGLRIRIEAHSEVGFWLPGGYYVFSSAMSGSDNWTHIMTFRHDDPIAIPTDNVRFVDEQVAFVFMGWMCAVTSDAGASWKVWDAERDLYRWDCCNCRLIEDVALKSNGRGVMKLDPIPGRQGEVPALATTDFGERWLFEKDIIIPKSMQSPKTSR